MAVSVSKRPTAISITTKHSRTTPVLFSTNPKTFVATNGGYARPVPVAICPPAVEIRKTFYSGNKRHSRPECSYTTLIAIAMVSSGEESKMTLKEIYEYIQ